MTKRPHRYGETPSKKPKTDNDLDDLWGDDLDLDESVINDCFTLAERVVTQRNFACTQLNNVSILPSYEAFKGQRNLFCSTQSAPAVNSSQKATMSAFSTRLVRNKSLPTETCDGLESKVSNLQEQIVAKEGEVAILRSQLKDMKVNFEVQSAKKQNEWVDKLNAKSKEMQAIQTKLEFKDLEIISLKQKITEISKVHSTVSVSCTQDAAKLKQNWKHSTIKEKSSDFKIMSVVDEKCPLQTVVPPSIFTVAEQEKYFVGSKKSDKPAALYRSPLSQFSSDESEPVQFTHNAKLNLSSVSSEIGSLFCSRAADIERSPSVHKIVNVSLALLHTFLAHLKQVELSCKTEDLIHADVVYLKQKPLTGSDVSVFEGKEMCENEAGINARQSVALLAEVLPYNSSLINCILDNLEVPLDPDIFPVEPRYDKRYSSVLLECVTLIGKLRLSAVCVGFLCAVIKLLENLSKCDGERFIGCFDLFKEIILCRPDVNVLLELSSFLKVTSQNAAFVEQFCTTKPQNALKLNVKEGFFMYNRRSCLFHIITVLCESSIEGLKTGRLLRPAENLLCFLHNIIALNCKWLYCSEKKSCDCVCQLIKLAIELIIGCLEVKNRDCWLEYSQVFALAAKLLHVINFRMCSLIEKYITVYSRFMEAVKKLLDLRVEMKWQEEITKLLENLILIDEDSNEEQINPAAFSNLSLWNK